MEKDKIEFLEMYKKCNGILATAIMRLGITMKEYNEYCLDDDFWNAFTFLRDRGIGSEFLTMAYDNLRKLLEEGDAKITLFTIEHFSKFNENTSDRESDGAPVNLEILSNTINDLNLSKIERNINSRKNIVSTNGTFYN